MNKAELVAKMADKAEVTKKDAEKVLNAFIETVQETLVAKDKISLVGFGTFETKHRAERQGINPQDPAKRITIPAADVPAFKVSKALKDAVAGK